MNININSNKLVRLLTLAGLCLFLQISPIKAEEGHWVTTWASAPQLVEPRNLPPMELAHNTLRQFVRVSTGGSYFRIRFSNAYGDEPVTINSAHLALAAGAGSAGDGQIDTATDTALHFRGAPGAVIPPGAVLYSDPFSFDLPALTSAAITIHFGDISASTITGHPGSRTTTFIKSGNTVSDETMAGAATNVRWYLIERLEVLSDSSSHCVAILGDSITDGYGTTTDANNRWPDILAQRLQANPSTANVSVANMGVGGNGVYGGLGVAARDRFSRDIVNQTGVRWAIIFISVNDIGYADNPDFADGLIENFTNFANQAHAGGIKVYGATVTPFGGNGYYSEAHESIRQELNTWIRTTALTSGLFDACIDFDAIVRDPDNNLNIHPAYNLDNLHLNPTGYEAMGNAIDLSLFEE